MSTSSKIQKFVKMMDDVPLDFYIVPYQLLFPSAAAEVTNASLLGWYCFLYGCILPPIKERWVKEISSKCIIHHQVDSNACRSPVCMLDENWRIRRLHHTYPPIMQAAASDAISFPLTLLRSTIYDDMCDHIDK